MTIYNVFSLFGGLGLFLYGMDLMGSGLQNAAGNKMKQILERLTTNRLTGVLVGTAVTMLIQSSSATTVMVVGFVNAGLMNLSQAFGVILGANIGTTITGQIIALNISDIAPLFIIVGVIFMMASKKRTTKSIGEIIAGFGILFTGMNMMSISMAPLRQSLWFENLMTSFSNPFIGVAIGAIFTAIIQSSSASVGILQALSMSGVLDVNAALYLVIGCNIGTCATALLASIGASTMARRTSILHLLNKIVGAVIFTLMLIILPGIITYIVEFSPDNPSQQVANFHTIFNILNTIILLPFGTQLIHVVEKLVKASPHDDDDTRLKYLDERVLDTPAIAMVQLKMEAARLAEKAYSNMELALECFFEQNEDKMLKALSNEKVIDFICGEISGYIVKVQGLEAISVDEQRELFSMHELIMDLERVGDHAENIAEYCAECMETESQFSPDATYELKLMSEKTMEALRASIDSLFASDSYEKQELVNICMEDEDHVDHMQSKLRENHIRRLTRGTCAPRAGMIFSDMAIDLERIADHAVNIAGRSAKGGVGTLYSPSIPNAGAAQQ